MESILTSIKVMIGIEPEYQHFDKALIPHINSAFFSLNQLGVGPEDPIVITNELDTWESKFGSTRKIEAVKSYVALKVQLRFDPPQTSFVLDSIKEQIKELEWRLQTQSEIEKEVK